MLLQRPAEQKNRPRSDTMLAFQLVGLVLVLFFGAVIGQQIVGR